nr:hypothetical protein [uncultured Flavobacterium sp.]
MCKCTGRRGEQGPEGPQGLSGAASFTKVRVSNTSVGSQTDLAIVASATDTTNIVFFGQFTAASLGAINYTLSVLVNGSVVSSTNVVATGPAAVAGTSYVTLPISNIVAITAGQAFGIRVTLSDYTQTTTIEGTIQYAYQ